MHIHCTQCRLCRHDGRGGGPKKLTRWDGVMVGIPPQPRMAMIYEYYQYTHVHGMGRYRIAGRYSTLTNINRYWTNNVNQY